MGGGGCSGGTGFAKRRVEAETAVPRGVAEGKAVKVAQPLQPLPPQQQQQQSMREQQQQQQ